MLTYAYFNIARIVFTMQVLKVRMCIEVTRFRNWVAISKSEDNFEIGTQFRNFQLAQRNFKIAQIYRSRNEDLQRPVTILLTLFITYTTFFHPISIIGLLLKSVPLYKECFQDLAINAHKCFLNYAMAYG